MKTTLETKSVTPVNPWENVKYPCLIEHLQEGYLGIAVSSHQGYIFYAKHKIPENFIQMIQNWDWESYGWKPAIGPRTVTFEN